MNEVAHYKFDVQGYLILPDVLSADEVAALNCLIDAQNLAEPGLETSEPVWRLPELGPTLLRSARSPGHYALS
ncbi:MAG: hypothetical protein R2911_29500 [Caldilineaceae bacterium]